MFFYMSKILWFFIDPSNVILVALCLGTSFLYLGWDKLSRWVLSLTALVAVIIATLPIGQNLFVILENRFPVNQALPAKVDGVIVMGGVVNQVLTRERGQLAVGGAAERLISFLEISRKYPTAKLIFTGGSGNIFRNEIKEGDVVRSFMIDMGVDHERLIIENEARNTFENAVFSKKLVNPLAHETWLLITSAFHMPRSIGVFRQAGWEVIPYPVDYQLNSNLNLSLSFNLASGLSFLSTGIHEWLGLLVYWLTNRTNTFFPSPQN